MSRETCAYQHCDLLVEAIDFFSQSLHLEQLIYYGFELVNKALCFEASALFIIEGDHYELKRSNQYLNPQKYIPKTSKLNSVATLFGRIMTGDYEKYFDIQDVEPFNPDLIIPIIVKDELVGFIIAKNSPNFVCGEKELTLAFAINQLMNKAYENARSFKALEEKNFELDKKIFNLFFINHCSRTLLSELQIEHIYQLCIDIIRELTASAVTSFFIHEPVTNALVMKGYKNILDFSQYYCELKLKAIDPKRLKVVYNFKKDRAILETIFEDLTEFEKLQAEYVLLIVKDKVVGLVTISTSVSERPYDETLFELIESVVTSIYISLTNALYFKAINEQKQIIQKKFETLTALNRAIRNINQCVEPSELFDVTLNTLKWGFDVKKALLLSVSDDGFIVSASSEEGWLGTWIEVPEHTSKRVGNQVYFHHDVSVLKDFIPDLEEYADLGGNCFVLAPIVVDKITLQGDYHLMGYILVTELKDMLQEEQILLVDSIANSIAPILDHMYDKRQIELLHQPNEEALFLEALKDELQNKELYDYSVFVQFAPHVEKPFEGRHKKVENSFTFKGFMFTLSDTAELLDGFTDAIEVETQTQFIEAFKTYMM